MTTHEEIRRMYRASWNKVVQSVAHLRQGMNGVDPDHVEGVEIDDLRNEVIEIQQRFHEFNAYRNAYAALRDGGK